MKSWYLHSRFLPRRNCLSWRPWFIIISCKSINFLYTLPSTLIKQFLISGNFQYTKIFVDEIVHRGNIQKGQTLAKFTHFRKFMVKKVYSCKDARMNRSTVLHRVTARALPVRTGIEKGWTFCCLDAVAIVQGLLSCLQVHKSGCD